MFNIFKKKNETESLGQAENTPTITNNDVDNNERTPLP